MSFFNLEPCTALIIATNSGSLTSVRKSHWPAGSIPARDHGGVIFVDLRDREGRTQVVFRPEESPEVAAIAHTLRNEDVVQITGKVTPRVEGTQNPKLATGEIEVVASSLSILNRSEILPFPLDSEVGNEDLRLTHRYLDLRRPSLVRNLKARHLVGQSHTRVSGPKWVSRDRDSDPLKKHSGGSAGVSRPEPPDPESLLRPFAVTPAI